MEAIRKYIDASRLTSIMTLPETFQNRKLDTVKKKVDIPSLVQSLIGSIPDTDMTLEEVREERRHKYETMD